MIAGDWLLVKHIFEAALNCAIEERGTLLDESCAGRPEVREEVESLLAAHRKAGAFLDRAEPFGEASSWVGRRLGSYRLVAEIGDGGMGRVFLAERDDNQFRKQVAVKIIGAGGTHPEILRRFLDERQILATLDHPNIARLLDGGVTDDGMPYMVMEYITGLPITAHCERAGLSVRERLELFRTVSLAVHYAHQHLVVHRDLKPANIMVTPEGAAVLLDFGIAKMLDPLTSRTQAYSCPVPSRYPGVLQPRAVAQWSGNHGGRYLLSRGHPLRTADRRTAARARGCNTRPGHPDRE